MSTVNHPYKNSETGGYQLSNLPENPFPTTKTSSLFDQLNDLDTDQVGQLKGLFGSPQPKFEMNLDAIRNMLKDTFGNPWTPWGYGWGGNNSNAVRINKSAASKTGSSYAGNKSSFNREGSRLNTQGTPGKSTL